MPDLLDFKNVFVLLLVWKAQVQQKLFNYLM